MQFTGLTLQEVQQSRATHGQNLLAPPRIPWWQEFLSKFEDPVIRILIIAAVIAFGVGLLEKHISIESIGIVIAILLATGLAFWNERKANAEFDVLNTTSDEAAVKAVRAGENQGGTFDSNQLLRSTMVVDGGGVMRVEKEGARGNSPQPLALVSGGASAPGNRSGLAGAETPPASHGSRIPFTIYGGN